jgi:hypothetical protein
MKFQAIRHSTGEVVKNGAEFTCSDHLFKKTGLGLSPCLEIINCHIKCKPLVFNGKKNDYQLFSRHFTFYECK